MNKFPKNIRLKNNELLYKGQSIGKCYREVDGFYVFWPDAKGFFNEHSLQDIAECLTVLNEPINEHLRKHL